jgi:hypothetical protein
MAIKGLDGFGWLLACVIGAPGCYLVSSQVASERARVEAVERAIITAHKDIRDLETEFDTRANLAQLERWNGEVMRYSAPTPAQFLESDTALASLRPLEGNGMAERYAAMIVPEGVPDVVAGTARTANDATAAISVAPKAKPVSAVTVKSANAIADVIAKPVRTAALKAKDEAVASLDSRLLKDSSFGDLMKGVRAEASRIR